MSHPQPDPAPGPTPGPDAALQERLMLLTAPPAAAQSPRHTPPALLRAAFAAAQARPSSSMPTLSRPLTGVGWAALAAVVLLGAVGLLLMPSLGKARQSARHVQSALERAVPAAAAPSVAPSSRPALDQPAGAEPALARRIIRRAAIELRVADVAVAAARVPALLSDADGEYIQESSITGDDARGGSRSARFTLRVAAPRLDKALADLRALGRVETESTSGDDVTDQAIDLEARLRSEQRIERELLTLLDTRKDSPLKEVLEVRAELQRVRDSIERLTAQRDRLGRLVALATVTVNLFSDAAAPPRLDTFADRIARAWSDGVDGLSGSAAWLVKVAVGGAIFWLPLIASAVAAWALRRRALRRAAAEPPLLV